MTEPSVILAATDVSKRFDSVVALRAASLEVRSGEVHGLMGTNGAGKSTLVKIITGVFPATGGQISVKGKRQSFRSPAEARAAGIVSVYQDPALVPDLTVEPEHAAGRRLERGGRANGSRSLASRSLDFRELIRDLPYPLLRLIDLARALASEPAVLLLDEITASLPADLSERIYAMMRRWRERGNAVIFISHRMAEISALCDRTTVLRDGVTVGVTESARGHEERIVATYAGRGGGSRFGSGPVVVPAELERRQTAPSQRSRCGACSADLFSTTSPLSSIPAKSSASPRSRARDRTSFSNASPASGVTKAAQFLRVARS